ncbi:MAG: TonB-dependent receptor [Holophagaceae bacterium]|nr:TonB-dependent receptor [Holophagaceae bacterium]
MKATRIFFILALGAHLSAETLEETHPKAMATATVSVSAEALPVELVKTPNPVRIIEGEDLARLQARTLADLLAVLQPGAIMNNGGPGKQSSAFLNGTLSKNVVILLDGLRLNDPTGISPDLGALSLLGIERVELLLGPTSVLHGSDAIGGVISLHSGSPKEYGFHGSSFLLGGTQAQSGIGAVAQLKGGWGWLSAGGEATRQGTDFPNDDFRQTGAFLRGGRRIGPFDLTLHYRNSGQTAETPFDVQYPGPKRVYVADRETSARQESWGANLRVEPAKNLELENVLGVIEGSNADPKGRGRAQQERSFRRFEDQLSVNWLPLANLRFSARLEGRMDTSEAKNYYDPTIFGNVQYRGEGRDLSAAVETRWEICSGLDWVSGLRREATHRDLTRASTGARDRVGRAEATTFKTGLNWIVNPSLRFYMGFGQGFRMPNLLEFTLNAQAEAVDRASYPISPEHSHTVQIGTTGRFGEHFEYRVEAQRTRISDLLAYRYDPTFSAAFTDHYENSGNVQASTLEGALGWKGGNDVVYGWDLVLRSQDTRDLDHNTDADRYGNINTAIVRHPFFTVSVALFAAFKEFRANLHFDRIGSRYDVQDLPPYQVISTGHAYNELNLSFGWTPCKHIALQVRGEHLLQPKQNVPDWTSGAFDGNGNAELVYGFPAPSRRASLSATYRW